MPATSTRFPASPAQLRFINALREERGMGQLDEATAALLTGGRDGTASRVITTLQNTPVSTPATISRSVRSGTAAPSQHVRAGRMLAAGGIEATVTLPDGEHVTIQVSTRVPRGRGWANGEPGDEGARTNIKVLGNRVGWVNVNGGVWSLTLRTRRPSIVQAVNALFQYAGNGDVPLNFRVQTADRCGRCRRTLTDPVSIDRGIGPECYGRSTGSHHAAVGTVEATPVTTEDLAALTDGLTARINTEALAQITPAFREVGAATVRATDSLDRLAAVARVTGHADERTAAARDLIEAALKAYVEDEFATDADARDALTTFDRLARS